jgi:hypothetical protein
LKAKPIIEQGELIMAKARKKVTIEAPEELQEKKVLEAKEEAQKAPKKDFIGDSEDMLKSAAHVMSADDTMSEEWEEASLGDAVEEVSEEEGRAFRYSARSIFLTYPKCTLRKEELGLLLKEKFNSKKLELSYLCVAEEKHKDGSSHLHAMALTTGKKIEARTASFMDFQGFHPNISVVKNAYAAYQYLHKEDKNPFEEGVFRKQKTGAASNYDLMVYRLAKYGLNRKTLAAFPSILFYLYRLVQALKIAAQLPGEGDKTDEDPFRDPAALGIDAERLDRLIRSVGGLELVQNDEFRVKDTDH